MHPILSLAHLTVLSLAPPEAVRVAARTGYQSVGLRLIAVTSDTPGYPLMENTAMMRETRAALADTGLRVNDIEFVKITPDIDVAALEPFVAAGAALGARYVIAGPYDPDLVRLSERLGALADLTARYGLFTCLEFFPWTDVPDLGSACRIVDAAARSNAGILLDTLHFDRSNSALTELAAIPADRLPFIHLCDAPSGRPASVEALLHTARTERLPPGEGGIDIASILKRLPRDIPIALEVPMDGLTRREGPEAVARRVRDAAINLLATMT